MIFLLILSSLFLVEDITCSPCQNNVRFDTGDTWIVVEETSKYVKIRVDDDAECIVDIGAVLIGGGGDTNTFIGHGGGSGYLTQGNISLTVSGSVSILVTIGRGGNFGSSGDSTVLELSGGDTLLGSPGGVGGEDSGGNGGNGYCGGGGGGANGYPAGDGGYDGGDGEHSPFSSEGGKGSGLNVTEVVMKNFRFEAGLGGVGVGFYGGGGGGVLVHTPDGEVIGDQGQDPEEGEGVGYGAGGSRSTNGVAILEIIS